MVKESRRRILARAVWAIAVAIGAAWAVILGTALAVPTFRRREENWLELGPVDQLGGTPQRFEAVYRQRQGWLEQERTEVVYAFRGDTGKVVVLSSKCTHLGCVVRWEASASEFRCPCHGGVYDSEGRVVSGPPPSSLVRPEVRIDRDRVFVRKA